MKKELTEKELAILAEKMKEMPASTQTALVHCLPNIPYGAFWGLVTKEELGEDKIASLRKDPKIFCFPVRDGVVIELPNNFVESELTPKFPFFFTLDTVKNSKMMAAEAEKGLVEFIQKARKKGGYVGALGIYSRNKVENVSIGDKDVSAFRVDIFTALQIFQQMNVQVMLLNSKVSAGEMLAELQSKNPSNVCKSLLMSPTKRAVFIKVVI